MHDLAKKTHPKTLIFEDKDEKQQLYTILKFKKEKKNTVRNKQITENIQTNK